MTDVSEDLSIELRRRLIDDSNILHKNQALYERVITACSEDGLEWSECEAVFKELGCYKKWAPKIVKASREAQGVPTIGGDPAPKGMPVRDAFSDAPKDLIHEDATAPPGWGYADPRAAVFQIIEKMVDNVPVVKRLPVSYDPVVISRRMQDVDSGNIMLELAWRVGRNWKTHTFDRDVCFSSRDLVRTAAHGVPVGTDNSLDLVKYLRAYEHHNLPVIMRGYVNSSMGWQGAPGDFAAHGFLCGKQQIGGNGKRIELHIGDGDRRAAAEFDSAGTLEGWREAIAPIAKWPIVQVGLYASLAAPLVAILEAPNCIVEWCGETTGGKTVTLQIAGSAWRNGGAKPATWNTTINGLEARASVLCDMPFIIDDTAEVPESKRRDLLTSAIYMLESGHTRIRANKDLTERASKTWRTVVLSTGEYMLAEYAGTGGAPARVLTFWGPPFGVSDPRTGEIITSMMAGLRRNYGLAGPAVVKWLIENRERWDEFRDNFARYISVIRSIIISPAAMRLAPVVALLEISAQIAHEVLGLPWTTTMMDNPIILQALERAVHNATTSANKARLAWEHALSYGESRRSQWIPWGETPKAADEPSTGWLGWRKIGATNDLADDEEREDLLAWHPPQLKRVLAEVGAPYEATLRSWRDHGVIRAQGVRTTSVVRCDGTRSSNRVVLMRTTRTPWSEDAPE